MKKGFFVAGSVLIALIAAGYFLVPVKITDMITHYDPYTFESVLQNAELRKDYGIHEKNVPEDYGYSDVEEFTIRSLMDTVKLNAWYVNSSHSSKSIVMVHGRTSNRLKTMKYLELFKEEGIDTAYNILIPDLRNSGKSDPAETFMGYKFAEDLTAYLQYLHNEKNQDTVILYGFSMGAMAIMTMMNRPELRSVLTANGIAVEKVILDSPLSNVKATLKKNADEMNLPAIVFEAGFNEFSRQTNNFAPRMSLSQLIESTAMPMLILQGNADTKTPKSILQEELTKIQKDNLQVASFENSLHVKAYQDEQHKAKYTDVVSSFIRN